MSTIENEHPPCSHLSDGVSVRLDWQYHDLAHASDDAILEITKAYPRTLELYNLLLNDKRTRALWDMAAYVTIGEMGLNDHGQAHAQVVAANALRMAEILTGNGVALDVERSGAGDRDDAMLVMLAAAMLHDIGNQIHREGHEAYGLILVAPLLERSLPQIYSDESKRHTMPSFILSAIATHDLSPLPVTMEAAIVAVADGTDMTQGRGRAVFELGKVDSHSLSALAVQEVVIEEGGATPIDITALIENPAGVFQVENILVPKVMGSYLREYVTVRVCSLGDDSPFGECVVWRNGHFEEEWPREKEAPR
ncbi:MAG: phosphohydrolase [Chloroflexi bacterium B3_Chlor]|nr:MAG: phosphohydrolase [Chloroflexi bacterium B3_Chlor]